MGLVKGFEGLEHLLFNKTLFYFFRYKKMNYHS